MGFFSSYTENDAIKQIDNINVEMRAISALLQKNCDIVDGRNKSEIRKHYNNILRYAWKYDKIKNSLSEIDRIIFLGATVDVWNGERVGVIMWESYFRNVIKLLKDSLNQ